MYLTFLGNTRKVGNIAAIWGARIGTRSMQVINANDVKVYNVSAHKSLPEVGY